MVGAVRDTLGGELVDWEVTGGTGLTVGVARSSALVAGFIALLAGGGK